MIGTAPVGVTIVQCCVTWTMMWTVWGPAMGAAAMAQVYSILTTHTPHSPETVRV